MKKFVALTFLAGCLAATASADSIVYGASGTGVLYSIIPTTGVETTIGTMKLGNTTEVMYDIAAYDGNLYGIDDKSNLYSINTGTAALTEIGTGTGDALNALTFNQYGVLYAAGNTESKLYTISLTTGTATAVPGETNTTAYNTSGDLEFINGTLYITTGNTTSSLETVNISTGALTMLGSTGYSDVYGLAYVGGTLYGFTDPGTTDDVISLNLTTGAGTLVHTYSNGFNGATDDYYGPEPDTFVLLAVGLGALLARRRLRLRS